MRPPYNSSHLFRYVTILGFMICSLTTFAQEKPFSGPQQGEEITPFKVLQVTGPTKVKETQIVKSVRNGPSLIVFLHKLTEPAIGLMITLEWYAHQHKALDSHYVFLTTDREKTEQQMKRWWRNPFFAGSPLSISLDGIEGPGRYGLNREVDMTVLVAKNNKVVSNFVLRAPNNTDAPKILAAISKAVGKPTPSYDKIRAEIRAERDKRRAKRLVENPIYKLAPNPQLGELMVAMLVTEGVNAEHVKRMTDRMNKWAGDDKKKKDQLAAYSKSILKGGFKVNRYARESLTKFAGDE